MASWLKRAAPDVALSAGRRAFGDATRASGDVTRAFGDITGLLVMSLGFLVMYNDQLPLASANRNH